MHCYRLSCYVCFTKTVSAKPINEEGKIDLPEKTFNDFCIGYVSRFTFRCYRISIFEDSYHFYDSGALLLTAVSMLISHHVCAFMFHQYKQVWTYTGIGELLALMKGITLSAAVTASNTGCSTRFCSGCSQLDGSAIVHRRKPDDFTGAERNDRQEAK